MKTTVRRLGKGDEGVLSLLGKEEADFDLDGGGEPVKPLSRKHATAYLADGNVLAWIAERGNEVTGFMYCHVLRKRAGNHAEIVLYEIGVRKSARRRGVGRALLKAMKAWMKAHRVKEVWVLADNPGAVKFYRATGFTVPTLKPTYMVIESS